MIHPVIHPVVERAARGQLPAWSEVGEKRRRHIERVAGLLEDWAIAAGLGDEERTRWVAAGYLHDALKEKPEAELRALLSGADRGWPCRPRPVARSCGATCRRNSGPSSRRRF
jgi:hypothetical protein